MVCPKCQNDDARRSHRQGVMEKAVSLVGIYPYRCACKYRFLRFRYNREELSPKRNEPVEREIRATRAAMRWKQRKRELLLFGSCFLLFLTFLYYLARDKGVPFDGN